MFRTAERSTLGLTVVLLVAGGRWISTAYGGLGDYEQAGAMAFAPQDGDSLLWELSFGEPMSSVEGELVNEDFTRSIQLEGTIPSSGGWPGSTWRSWIPITAWGEYRNQLQGKWLLRVAARDLAGNLMDTDPSTPAYRGPDGRWIGLEGDDGVPGQEGGRVIVDSIYILPMKDTCLVRGVSADERHSDLAESHPGPVEQMRSAVARRPDSLDWRIHLFRSGDTMNAPPTTFGFGPNRSRGSMPAPTERGETAAEAGEGSTNLEANLLRMAAYAESLHSDPRLLCVVSNFLTPGPSVRRVEWLAHSLAEGGPLVFLANDGAPAGSHCTKELREAARSSGGGYYAGLSEAETASLHRVVSPILTCFSLLTYLDGRGLGRAQIPVDSTVVALDVVISIAAWSDQGILRERAEGLCPSSTECYLIDSDGVARTPDLRGGRIIAWHIPSPHPGIWEVGIDAEDYSEYSIVARGESPIRLRLLAPNSLAESSTDTIEVRIEWKPVTGAEFDMVDMMGRVAADLRMEERPRFRYFSIHKFHSPGHYRIRMRAHVGGQYVERLSDLCVHVRPRPQLSLTVEPLTSSGMLGPWLSVRWHLVSPQLPTVIAFGCDTEAASDRGRVTLFSLHGDDPAAGLVISPSVLPAGPRSVWALADDGLNEPVRVFAPQSQSLFGQLDSR